MQFGVLIFAGWGSSLPAQSAVGNTPPVSVTRDTGSVGRNLVTEAAARLGVARAEFGTPLEDLDSPSAGQTMKWVLIAGALFLAGVVALILSNY